MANSTKATRLKVMGLCFICACHQPEKENQSAANNKSKASPQTAEITAANLCFRQISGRQNQDTAWVELKIDHAQVSGSYINLPFEKDSRKGTLQGTKAGDKISATWFFRQEGQTDSLPVQFRLTSNQLLQKPYSYNRSTGREYLADTTAYNVIFEAIDCADFPRIK
ncbi:MAG: hypothetical protein COW65_01360 [Cytophagales bacterium CG18_big_fil_WC_8_21_14_2_50_42_9]|nr:MAG: hypothetical protein COW65_01360 [Cytophagales bacterium CG18_big_fil_WC_8_21_14_2_50_42_9]